MGNILGKRVKLRAFAQNVGRCLIYFRFLWRVDGMGFGDARYAEEGADFVPKYKKLLYTTPVATAEDAAALAGIDLTDKAFWRSALQTIAEQIELFCKLAEEEV